MKNRSLILCCAALSIASQPAFANDPRFNDAERIVRAPAGASVTLGLRVPLGAEKRPGKRMTYGLTAAYGMHFENSQIGNPVRTHKVELAQLNFDRAGPRDIQLANYSLTQFGRDDVAAQKLNMSGGNTILIIGGVALAVVAVAFLATSDEDFDFSGD